VTTSLTEFAAKAQFSSLSVVDQILHLAWYLHSHGNRDRIVTGDIRKLYDELHLTPPNVSSYLSYLSDGKGKRLIRDKRGFRVEGKCRTNLDGKFSSTVTSVNVTIIAQELRKKLTNIDEIAFLDEAYDCYRVGAFRSVIVMVWCLAISHLMEFILSSSENIDKYNAALKLSYPKKLTVIVIFEDFAELKEFEVIAVAQKSNIITKNRADIMREKLKRRNMAAHPSSIHITQAQVDDFVTDLVNNIVAKL